jgi:maltose alpha-D-glucosyltransferase/alpha-amylase
MQQQRRVMLESGELRFTSNGLLPDEEDFSELEVRRPIIEQSHTSIFFGEKFIFKIYRQVQEGANPELQMGRYLTKAPEFNNIARVAGSIELELENGQVITLGILQEFIDNQNDAWTFTLNYLERYEDSCLISAHNPERPERKEEQASHNMYLTMMKTLGQRIGQMHKALAAETDDPDFKPEIISTEEWQKWSEKIETSFIKTIKELEKRQKDFDDELKEKTGKLIENQDAALEKIRSLIPEKSGLYKTRHHGDLHLGQILLVANDFIIIDFEGEPARPLKERIAKFCPLRDVAGILRSFSYAAETARRRVKQDRPEALDLMKTYTKEWEKLAGQNFLDAYLNETQDCISVPNNKRVFKKIVSFLSIEKAVYELNYELANRPDWVEIPVCGLIEKLDL